MSGNVSVIVPAYNEARMLPITLAALRTLDAIDEIVVVDDGSTDDSWVVAEGTKTVVIRLERNVGKGRALRAGAQAATGTVMLLLDADVGESASESIKLLAPIADGEADLVIGAFGSMNPAGFGIVQAVARAGINRLTGLTMNSPLSGQRAFHRRLLDVVSPFADGFGAEVALTVDAARAGLRIVEVPVAMKHVETGRDWRGFVHRGKQLLHVGAALLPRLFARPDVVAIRHGDRGGD